MARAFAVLNCFTTGPSTLGLSEIARRVGLSTSIVYRLLRSLVDAGVLEQDERTTRYRLGTGLASLAEVFFRQRRLDLAEPELRRLSDEARGSAGLAMRDGRDALILVYAPTHLPSSTAASRPRRVPLHLSAMGKVLLAFGDPDDSGGARRARRRWPRRRPDRSPRRPPSGESSTRCAGGAGPCRVVRRRTTS